jgi:hypothetical protein
METLLNQQPGNICPPSVGGGACVPNKDAAAAWPGSKNLRIVHSGGTK